MDGKRTQAMHDYTKILIPADSYNLSEDKRLLIPFTHGENIGFMNHEGEIIVNPKYNMYYGECYDENDFIKVSTIIPYGFSKGGNRVSSYYTPMYGLINYEGKEILGLQYRSLMVARGNKRLFTVQNKNYQYSVITSNGEEIVPAGKYHWIDGFERGFARVKIGMRSNDYVDVGNKWGVINELGEEVIPCTYSNIWNFYGKSYNTIKIADGEVLRNITFASLMKETTLKKGRFYERHKERPTFEEHTGSYAQDVMGYSDDIIDDAFEGDPDAYWNID